MKLEVGKLYRLRDGRKAKIERKSTLHTDFPYKGFIFLDSNEDDSIATTTPGFETWTESGQWNTPDIDGVTPDSALDIVSPWLAEATPEEPRSRFDAVVYDMESLKAHHEVKLRFKMCGQIIEVVSPKNSREKSMALTALEEAFMWVGKAILEEQLDRTK